MIKKTLCFSNPAYLSLKDEQLVIKFPEIETSGSLSDTIKKDSVVTRSIEDIGVIILENPRITITSRLLSALLQNNCAIITCNERNMPIGLQLLLDSNKTQSEIFRNQIGASLPLKKQLWQQTIQSKIHNQFICLKICRGNSAKTLQRMENSVRSGDPDNIEGQAAAFYWKNLFGDMQGFIRDREGPYPNNMLNYGYTLLRAVVARSLVSSGLLPTLGIHHHNRYNAYCLADDMMEPYRPYVDWLVYQMVIENDIPLSLTKEVKAKLLSIPTIDVTIKGHQRPLMIGVSETTASLAKCFSGELRRIAFPELDG